MAKKPNKAIALPIHILNGPNLNLLGSREPEIYGKTTLGQIKKACAARAKAHGFSILFDQSNKEGALVDMIQAARTKSCAVIINAAAYTHTSVAVLDALNQRHGDGMTLVRLPLNLGKGGAMMSGLRKALALGYSHALQIDADGQHDVNDIPRFLASARQHPQAVVCGQPVYDASVPKGRLYGRYLTHVWVWINTLSLRIRDSMCGYRVYPLSAVVSVLDGACLGRRMDFALRAAYVAAMSGAQVAVGLERLGGEPAGLAHALEGLGPVDLDGALVAAPLSDRQQVRQHQHRGVRRRRAADRQPRTAGPGRHPGAGDAAADAAPPLSASAPRPC